MEFSKEFVRFLAAQYVDGVDRLTAAEQHQVIERGGQCRIAGREGEAHVIGRGAQQLRPPLVDVRPQESEHHDGTDGQQE